MRNWRVVTAIAAVVLAALAGVLVWKYTSDAKDEAKKPFTLEKVLVASQKVPRDTSFDTALTRGLITHQERVKQDLPETSVDGTHNDADLRKQFNNLVASHDIEAGQTVVLSDFVTAGSSQSDITGTLSTDEAKAGKNNAQAISINVDDTHAVAGFVAPGDHVNVLLTLDVKDLTSASGKVAKTTAFLLPGLKVLAVGSTTNAPGRSTAANATNGQAAAQVTARNVITVEVNSRQAEQIAEGTTLGSIYLTLMPATFKPGDDFAKPDEIAETKNLFDQTLNVTNKLLDDLKNAK